MEDNEMILRRSPRCCKDDNIEVTIAATGKEALELMSEQRFRLHHPRLYAARYFRDRSCHTRSTHSKNKLTPVIVYSAKDFRQKRVESLKQMPISSLLKGVNSLEHLLEETILQLHINHKDLLPEKRRIIENIRMKEDILTGKNFLCG